MRRITVEMMADALGIPVQALKKELRKDAFDFGTAIRERGKPYLYIIYPEIAKQYVPERIYRQWELDEAEQDKQKRR